MSAYSNEIKTYIERYKKEVRNDGLIDPHDFRHGRIKTAYISRMCDRSSI